MSPQEEALRARILELEHLLAQATRSGVPASPLAPELYDIEASTREAVDTLWDRYGWDRECCIPSVDDVVDHMRGYIEQAYARGANFSAQVDAALRGAA